MFICLNLHKNPDLLNINYLKKKNVSRLRRSITDENSEIHEQSIKLTQCRLQVDHKPIYEK